MKVSVYKMNFNRCVIERGLNEFKFGFVSEYCCRLHDTDTKLNIMQYGGDDIRVYKESADTIRILLPSNDDGYLQDSLCRMLDSGSIYENAEKINSYVEYVMETCIPNNAMEKRFGHRPKNLQIVIALNLGKCNNDGDCDIDQTRVDNCVTMKDELMDACHRCKQEPDGQEYFHKDISDIFNHHTGLDRGDLPDDNKMNMMDLKDDLNKLDSLNPEDSLDDTDFDDIDIEEDDEEIKQEFFLKKPKKLKPFPNDLIPYITVEMNDIQSANDQAMLCGYISSKIELCDFYINCIDTQDSRYIVPHTRQFLVNLNNNLNNLLTQCLKIKPINKNSPMWKVNYPDGYAG